MSAACDATTPAPREGHDGEPGAKPGARATDNRWATEATPAGELSAPRTAAPALVPSDATAAGRDTARQAHAQDITTIDNNADNKAEQ